MIADPKQMLLQQFADYSRKLFELSKQCSALANFLNELPLSTEAEKERIEGLLKEIGLEGKELEAALQPCLDAEVLAGVCQFAAEDLQVKLKQAREK
jgi:hypothetical protein